ncbi:MAG: ammonium transporter [Clostridia bacterium]|nr:ammonium transporter [Clostridia bacterium]
MRRPAFAGVLAALSSLVVPAVAWAAEGPTPESNAVAINTAWTLVTAFLVFFMQAGFAMVEAGMTRAKNTINICLKNLLDFCVGSIAFWAIGFAFMFGADAAGFIGTSGFFTTGKFEHLGLSIPLLAFLIFQTVFAGTAATIVSGAMAERTKFGTYLVFSLIMTAVIYPVVGHWIWGGGWLAKMGMLDFAGSTVVHSVGGWAALAGCILLGPRLGKYGKDGTPNRIAGHNMALATLGVFILWFGWFGFNPGSTLSATDPNVARIAVTTNLAAAAGALTALFYTWIKEGKANLEAALNGTLAGLVGITAPCAFVSGTSAVIIGAVAGLIVMPSIAFFERVKVDDAVGAISVHATAGVWGTLSVGLFHESNGLFFGGGFHQLWVQIVGIVAVAAWTLALSFLSFAVLKAVMGLRVTPDEEVRGLDLEEHGGSAYPDFFAVERQTGQQAHA